MESPLLKAQCSSLLFLSLCLRPTQFESDNPKMMFCLWALSNYKNFLDHRVHRVAMVTFWRAFHHDGKISPSARPPPFTLSTITSKVVVYAPDTLPPLLLYPYVFSVVWAIKSTKTAAWREFSNFAKLHNKPDKCVNLGKMLHDVSRVLGQKYLFLTRIVWEEFCPLPGRGGED